MFGTFSKVRDKYGLSIREVDEGTKKVTKSSKTLKYQRYNAPFHGGNPGSSPGRVTIREALKFQRFKAICIFSNGHN